MKIIMDTIILTIPLEHYEIIDRKKFKPFFDPINSSDYKVRIRFLQENRGLKKYVQNPSVIFRDQGIVYPNLTLEERFVRLEYSCNLKISFSCPKILWGHSFDEPIDKNFSQLVSILAKRLLDMGVFVSEEKIKTAIVQTLHYAVNIPFDSQETARMFLERLSQTGLQAWFENNTKTFSNNGKAVRFHTKIFEIVFYLKYYDVLEAKGRSVGRHTTKQEKGIAKKLQKEGNVPPVVRIELRFNGKRSIQSHLKTTLGIDKKDWIFQEVFNVIKSRKTIQYYWKQIIGDPLNRACLCAFSDSDICENVLKEFKDTKIRIVAESLGYFFLLKNLGVKRLKEIISQHNRKAWYDKRKIIIDFLNRFVEQDDSLIKFVTGVLEKTPVESISTYEKTI
jgi:hypothetical protein